MAFCCKKNNTSTLTAQQFTDKHVFSLIKDERDAHVCLCGMMNVSQVVDYAVRKNIGHVSLGLNWSWDEMGLQGFFSHYVQIL